MLSCPELLSPAGSLEALKYAVMYGADAVYCALPRFGMRAAPVNLTIGELHDGCIFAHARGKKVYLTLNNLPNYLGVSDNLDTVIEYIMARDITTLPAGRTRIDGDKAVVTVSPVTPQTSDKALFQRHDNHITLETDLDGSELFEVSLAELTPTKPTDEAADTTVGTAGTSIAGMLCEGRFALYLAGEPYKSGLKAQGCGKLKKAVFSIELDPDEEETEE